MYICKALLIGIVQGLTAFLPVSSSGHCMLLYTLLDMQATSALTLAAAGHLGSLMGIIFFMQKELIHIIVEIVAIPGHLYSNIKERFFQIKRGSVEPYTPIFTSNYGKITQLCLLGNIVTMLVGIALHDLTERLADHLLANGLGFLITALFLLVAVFLPNGSKTPQELKTWQIILAGIFQGLTVFPGISRFAVMMVVFLLFGQTKKASIKCSVLMSVPVLAGTFLYTAGGCLLNEFSIETCNSIIVSAVAASFACCLSIRACLSFVQRHKFTVFSIYCFLAALFCIGYHLYQG